MPGRVPGGVAGGVAGGRQAALELSCQWAQRGPDEVTSQDADAGSDPGCVHVCVWGAGVTWRGVGVTREPRPE